MNKKKAIAPKKKGRPITQYSAEGKRIKTYLSFHAAAELLTANPYSLKRAANNKYVSAAGYLWRWESKPRIDLDELQEWLLLRNKGRLGIAVTQYNMNGYRVAVYRTASEAARAVGSTSSNISNVIKNSKVYSTVKGFIWQKGEGPLRIAVSKLQSTRKPRLAQKPVTQYTLTGKRVKRFKSAYQAAQLVETVTTSRIVDAATFSCYVAGGYYWSWVDKPAIKIKSR